MIDQHGPRVLVAGIGNIFLGDDGFGVEVVRRLQAGPVPDGVRVLDVGIRGVHLAYELLDGAYDGAILVDAVAKGGAPGTLYLLEPEPDAAPPDAGYPADAHRMDPHAVLAFVRHIGGTTRRVLVVGCEPACVDEELGLSPAVASAVPGAVDMVLNVCASQFRD